MRNIIIVMLLLNLIALLPLGYFYYRDIIDPSVQARRNADCVPYDLKYEKLGPDKVRVKWKTGKECIGYVRYSDDQSKVGNVLLGENAFGRRSEHEAEIGNLNPTGFYYLYLYSEDKIYGQAGYPIELDLSKI